MVIFPPCSHNAALSVFVLVNVLSSSPEHWNELCQIILWRLGSKFKKVWPIDQMMVESFLISQRAKLTEWENGEIGYDATPLTFRVNVTTDKSYQRAARDQTKEFEMCAFWCIAWNITIVPFSKENIFRASLRERLLKKYVFFRANNNTDTGARCLVLGDILFGWKWTLWACHHCDDWIKQF